MPASAPFWPTLKWHIVVLASLLILLSIGLWVMRTLVRQLPDPYRPKQPAPQTTPWLNNR